MLSVRCNTESQAPVSKAFHSQAEVPEGTSHRIWGSLCRTPGVRQSHFARFHWISISSRQHVFGVFIPSSWRGRATCYLATERIRSLPGWSSGTSIEVVVDSRSSFVQKIPVSWPFTEFSNNFSEMASASLSWGYYGLPGAAIPGHLRWGDP